MVRIPQVQDLATAIRLYYERHELGNADITALFGKLGSATICKLKDKAREQMAEDNVPSWNGKLVNTEAAYKAWGLDIDRMERSFNKLKKLGLS